MTAFARNSARARWRVVEPARPLLPTDTGGVMPNDNVSDLEAARSARLALLEAERERLLAEVERLKAEVEDLYGEIRALKSENERLARESDE